MADICITSDVETARININYNNLVNIDSLDLNYLKNGGVLLQIRGYALQVLKNEIEDIADHIQLNRAAVEKVIKIVSDEGKILEFKRTTSTLEYKGETIEVDIRNDEDFRFCALVDFTNILNYCICLEGTLFIYNRSLFAKYYSESIIAFLRFNYWQSKEDLMDGLNKLRVNLDNSNLIDDYTLGQALEYLQGYGFIYHDKNLNVYQLTARGYMFW